MASKDESAPGLLSRVVRFVKNPATNWGEQGEADTDRESSYSKQMLKEMIERKRRNDFVRKREFDMLRKMRRSEVLAGSDPGLRPSFFQSSMPSKPDDRATTLKKIDEIEAQMSMQWWKTKHGEVSSRSGSSTNFPMSSHIPPDAADQPSGAPAMHSTAYTRTTPASLDQAQPNEKTQPAELPPMLDYESQQSLQHSSAFPAPAPAPAAQGRCRARPVPGPAGRRRRGRWSRW